MDIKNQKGITLMAEVITIVVFMLILTTISYSSISSLQVRALNSMYADIVVIQEKAANYYLKYGEAPVSNEEIVALPDDIKTDPNDEGGKYYKVDFSKLLNVSLNNKQTEDDFYYMNDKTLTVYYSKGVTISNLNSNNKEVHYTLPSNYTNVQKIDVEKYK